MSYVLHLLNGGAGNLAAYLAAHVLLCLLPAFFIAGAMAALIPKASITRFLGRTTAAPCVVPGCRCGRFAAGRLLLHHRAAVRGHLPQGRGPGPGHHLPVLRAGGQHHGAGLHRQHPGAEFAAARFVLCLLFGIGIGLLMALLFWRDDASHDAQTDTLFADKASIGPAAIGVLLSLVALLIAGTLKLWPLTATVATVNLPLPWAEGLAGHLVPLGAFRRGQGRRRRERAGLAADRAAAADRCDRLEGSGKHRRRRQPLDLDRPGPGRHHLAGGGAAAQPACGRAAGRPHRPRVRRRADAVGRAALCPTAECQTTGRPGCGNRGAS